MNEIEVFHFDSGKDNFESYGKDNGYHFWYASDLMKFLGYESWPPLRKAVNKAMAACAPLGVPIAENFTQAVTIIDGKSVDDWKLSRFACYFVTMFCDQNKPQVQKAFAYFSALAVKFEAILEQAENCERLEIREEISSKERVLAGVAKNAGVQTYAFFQNAGYRGLYNMDLNALKSYKGLKDKKRSLLDFMGGQELAANLFRIKETEAKLRNEGITGQRASELAAEKVGAIVRKTMKETSGSSPEDLPLAKDINETRKKIKSTARGFKKIDGPKKKSITKKKGADLS